MSRKNLFSSFIIKLLTIVYIAASSQVALGYSFRRNQDGKILIWDSDSVDVMIDTTDVKHIPGAADAVRASFAEWISGGIPLSVYTQEVNTPLTPGADNTNIVKWITSDWGFDHEVVAITVTLYDKESGYMFESDFQLNAQDYDWVTDPGIRENVFDIQNVMTHEAGHFFGLGHSEDGEATMYPYTPPNEISKRDLSTDDMLAITALIEEISKRRQIKLDDLLEYQTRARESLNHSDGSRVGLLLVDRKGCNLAGESADPPWMFCGFVLFCLWRRKKKPEGS